MIKEHLFVKCNSEVNLSVNRVRSDGLSIVLIHGLASNSGLYSAMVEQLSSLGFDVVTIDLRGHGLSDKPSYGYDYKTISNDIFSILTSLKLKKPLMVGQSWGGNVVLDFMSRNEFESLGGVLIDGGWIHLKRNFKSFEDVKVVLSPPRFEHVKLADLETRFKALHKDWTKVSIEGTLMNFHEDDDGFVKPNLSFENHIKILKQLYDDDPILKAKSITQPIMLIVAGSKSSDKAIQVTELESCLKVYKTFWYENADHDIHAQMPELVTGLINNEINSGIFHANLSQ